MAPSIARLSYVALLASTVLATPSPLKLDFIRERSAPHFLSRRANGELNVALNENQQQNSYVVKLSIGTPAQAFQLILDTGSSDLWVPDNSDPVCNDGTNACTFGTYDSSASSTFQVVSEGTFAIQYGDGSENVGDYISDVVTIDGVTLQDVTFGLALNSSSIIPGETAQGLLGVGYRALSSANGKFPILIDSLFSNGAINRRAFSLYLNDAASGAGSILFGGVDTDKYTGELVTLPIVPDVIQGQSAFLRYLVDLTAVGFTTASSTSFSSISPSGMATAALLDSGTTEIVIDSSIFNNVVSGIGAVPVSDQGETVYVASCSAGNNNAALSFTFGGSNGITINVPISALLSDLQTTFGNGDEACELLMRPTDASSPSTVLGDSFLRSAYVVYDLDNNQVSLAQANLNSTSESIQVIPSGTAGLAQASSTAAGTASAYTYDNAAASTAVQTAVSTGSSAQTDVPQSAASPTYSGIANPSGSSGGSGGAASSSGAASHMGLVASTPVGMVHMGVLVSVAACVFAGMLVL